MSYVIRNCLRKASSLNLLTVSKEVSDGAPPKVIKMDSVTLNVLQGFVASVNNNKEVPLTRISDKELGAELSLDRSCVYKKRKELISLKWLKCVIYKGKKYVEFNIQQLWELLENKNTDKSLNALITPLIEMLGSDLLPMETPMFPTETKVCQQKQHIRDKKEYIKKESSSKKGNTKQPSSQQQSVFEKVNYDTDSIANLIKTQTTNEEIREKDIIRIASEVYFYIKQSDSSPEETFRKAMHAINNGSWKTPYGFNHGSSVYPSSQKTNDQLREMYRNADESVKLLKQHQQSGINLMDSVRNALKQTNILQDA